MKIFVCIKQVPDTETKIKINSDHTGIDESGVKWVMNPYDEFAVEESLKLKQSNEGSEVTIVSIGPKKRVVDAVRTALAMGADNAVVVDSDQTLDAYTTAKALTEVIRQEGDFGMILTGKQAIDDNAASVSQMLAEFLEIPHATVVSKLDDNGDDLTIEREVEGGTREVLQLQKPAMISANKGLNTPRYASLPGIMKAKKKPLKEMALSDLSVNPEEKKVIHKDYQLPPEKPPVKMIEGEAEAQAKALVRLLREEAKVV